VDHVPTGDDERQDNKPPATSGTPPGPNDKTEDQTSSETKAANYPGAEQLASAIGRQLKENYGKLLREPVPQRFLDLLDELEAKTSSRSRSADKHEGGA
jgi:hypothetical protein